MHDSPAARIAVIVLGCWALSACIVIPQPREVIQLSPVDGRLLQDGHPLAGVPLTMNSLHNTTPCAEPIARILTSANGEFAFDEITARKTWRAVVLAPSSPTYSMTLCMDGEAGPTPIFAASIRATLPVTLTLLCDVGATRGSDQACGVTDWTGHNFLSVSGEQRGEYRAPARPPSDAAKD